MKVSNLMMLILMISISLRCFSQAAQSDEFRQKAEELSIEGRYSKSLEYYLKAYRLVEKNDQIRAANLCNDMSSAYYGEGNYAAALQNCRSGMRHLEKQKNAPDSIYFKLYSSLGTMHNALENRDSAYFYFQWADAVLERSPVVEKDIPLYVLHHYLHQGRSFWALHRYHQSISYFIRASRISEKYGLTDELDYIESSLAEVYDLLGQHRKALSYRLAATKHKFLNSKRQQELSTGVALTYLKLGLLDSSLVWHRLSWKKHLLQPKNTWHYNNEHIKLLLGMGVCYRQKGQLCEAEYYLRHAGIYCSKKIPNQVYLKACTLIEKGKLAYTRSQLSTAESFYDEAFKAVKLTSSGSTQPVDLIYPQIAFIALGLKASLLSERYRRSNRLEDLRACYQSFKELIALKRATFLEASQDNEERQFVSEESIDVFREAVPIGYEMYKQGHSPAILQEVFSWFEDANASYLFEMIRDKHLFNQNIPPEIAALERQLIQKRAALAGAAASDSSALMQRQIEDLRLSWYKLRKTINKKYTSGSSTLYDPIKISTVQNNLDAESAFVSYKWFDDKMYVFVVTRKDIQLVSWDVNNNLLLSHIKKLQKEFNYNPGFGNYNGSESAIGVHKILIEPLKKWLANKTRLIVARDWQFNFLPLEILETGKKNNDYLTLHYSVSYTYSAALFWKHPSLANPSKFSRFGFNTSKSSMFVAPFVKQQIAHTSSGWKPVSSLLDMEEIGGENLWGEKATKQEFLKTGMGYHILHLATHAEAEDENPNDSFIQFFPGTDSRLYLSEIYTMPLYSTRLMVLTACSAGKGKNIRGEGNISLAHAIAQAGCPSVVTTIWEANDEVISYLSVALHKHLEDGLPIDKAIQMARLDFFRNNKYKKFSHPYYWANFTLIGNNEPVYSGFFFQRSRMAMIGGGSIIVFVLLFMLIKIRTKTTIRHFH